LRPVRGSYTRRGIPLCNHSHPHRSSGPLISTTPTAAGHVSQSLGVPRSSRQSAVVSNSKSEYYSGSILV